MATEPAVMSTETIKKVEDIDLKFNDAPSLVWVFVREASDLLWVKNPKLHDMGAIITSIQTHGFQAPPKFDINLLNSLGDLGAIKDGNGRVEALVTMENGGTYQLPRGLAEESDTGYWAMPVLIGTDAISSAMAQAYALDANNVGMMGNTEFSPLDLADLYEGEMYREILEDLSQAEAMPVSMGDMDIPDIFDGLDDDMMLENERKEEEEQGTHLAQLDITIDDPVHHVVKGQTWKVGPHILVCVDVFEDWALWTPHLEPGDLFIPFPGPFIALSLKSDVYRLIMVQPDGWIAGHILDRYSDVHGEGEVALYD